MASTKTYQWRDGSRIKNVSAETAAHELETIRARDGKLEAETIVEHAKPAESPIHPAFEWRDKVAAHQYRLDQARNLVRSIVVVDAGEADESVSAPMYVHVRPPESGTGYYQSTMVAIQDADEWATALKEMSSIADSALRSLETLQRLAQGKDARTVRKVTKAATAVTRAREAVLSLQAA